DRFRGRVTFPVHDLSGKAVGIGARILPGERDEGPKYMNSPETPVYRKGEVLYNLDRAKAAVSKSGELVIVEGYTDVIALASAADRRVHAPSRCATPRPVDHRGTERRRGGFPSHPGGTVGSGSPARVRAPVGRAGRGGRDLCAALVGAPRVGAPDRGSPGHEASLRTPPGRAG